jgi:glycerol-3-phosphate dehydrogenase subunit B
VSARVIVVGAGLAGLVAACRLAEAGVRVDVVAKGVGGLHLSAGTIGVLGYAPDRVDEIAPALERLRGERPDHPYARMDPGRVADGVEVLRSALGADRLVGDLDRNMLVPTALGAARPSALVPDTMAEGRLEPGARYLLVGLRALRDFSPDLAAATLPLAADHAGVPGVEARPAWLGASPRPDAADTGGMVFARAFDDAGFRRDVAAELRPLIAGGERVGLPAVLGLRSSREAWEHLQDLLGAPVFEIPTLPPCIPGVRIYEALRARLRALGGGVLMGSVAVGADRYGDRLTGVLVESSDRTRIERADAAVLASGGFASGGLDLDSRGRLRETVFDLPVVGAPGQVGDQLDPRYFGEHLLLTAGLAVDADMRPVDADCDPALVNLHAAGAIIAGATPWREHSGEGICLASAITAADAVLANVADPARSA